MSLACSHMPVYVGHVWDARYPHVFAGAHMCLTCENLSSHVGRRVKLKQHMSATCEPMWATCGPHVCIQCDFSVGDDLQSWALPSKSMRGGF